MSVFHPVRAAAPGAGHRLALRIRDFLQEYGWAYFFVTVPVALFAVFMAYPVFWAFLLSFQKYSVFRSEWVGLKNYIYLFTSPTFAPIYWKALGNTLIWTVATVPTGILTSLFLAVLIVRLPARLQTVFKFSYYLPVVASGIILSLVWLWIFDPLSGLLNYLVGLVGISPRVWLGDSRYALLALILQAVLGAHGGTIVLYCAALGGIPRSLYEAAELDGASAWTAFWRITWPLIKPTTVYLFITGIIGAFQVFGNVYVLTQGGPNFSTVTLGYLIYETAFQQYNFGSAAAQSFVLGALIITLSLLNYKYLATDVEY